MSTFVWCSYFFIVKLRTKTKDKNKIAGINENKNCRPDINNDLRGYLDFSLFTFHFSLISRRPFFI